jgi:hypothetical protein
MELPVDFLIIGAQKCGTTSLYNYLIQHPQIVPARTKEVHFFDLNFNKGIEWYQDQFHPFERQNNLISGEASPYYIFHPLVAERVQQILPKVKIIILLRNPVDRAISHYYHEVRLGVEEKEIEQAIGSEPTRIAGETEKLIQNPNHYSFNHQHYTYISRGKYIDQIKNWLNHFPKQQILILKSEDLYNHPPAILKQVCNFLQIPPYQLPNHDKYNAGQYPPIDPAMYQQLTTYFHPYNQNLEKYLGRTFNW